MFEKRIKVTVDAKCVCGWLLPHAVSPMRNVPSAGMNKDDLIPDAIVALVCPVCDYGHIFLLENEIAKRSDLVAVMPGKENDEN